MAKLNDGTDARTTMPAVRPQSLRKLGEVLDSGKVDGVSGPMEAQESSGNEYMCYNDGVIKKTSEETEDRLADSTTISVQPRVVKGQMKPTQKHIDEHVPLHTKYEHWCQHSVFGQAGPAPHKASVDNYGGCLAIVFSLDDCSMTTEEKDEDIPPVLVIYDHKTVALCALEVEATGAATDVLKFAADKIE